MLLHPVSRESLLSAVPRPLQGPAAQTGDPRPSSLPGYDGLSWVSHLISTSQTVAVPSVLTGFYFCFCLLNHFTVVLVGFQEEVKFGVCVPSTVSTQNASVYFLLAP